MTKRINRGLFLVFSFLVVLLEFGMIFAFGTVFIALLDKYEKDRATTAFVPSLLVGVTSSFGVVSGALITKVGLRWITLISCILVPVGFSASFFATSIEHLYVSIGIVSGIGISMGYISAVVVIGRIFRGKKRALLLAVQSSFSSVSGLIYPYFFDWLIGLYGLNGMFLLLGAIYGNMFPFFIICWMNRNDAALNSVALSSGKTSEVKTGEERVITKPNTRKRILNVVHTLMENINRTYVIIVIASAISIAAINAYTVIVLDICRWKGFSISQGLFTFVIFNIASTLSRLIPGLLEQTKGFDVFVYPIIAAICGCIGQLLLYIGTSYALYVTGTFLTGLTFGGVVSSQVILVVKVVRVEFFPVGSGLLFTMAGLITAAIGPIFGSLRDHSGTYGSVVLTIGSIQVIAAMLFGICLVCRRNDIAKEREQQSRHNSIYSITTTHL